MRLRFLFPFVVPLLLPSLPAAAMECMDHTYFTSISARDVGLCSSHMGLLSLYGTPLYETPSSPAYPVGLQPQPTPPPVYYQPYQQPTQGSYQSNQTASYKLPDPSSQPIYGEPAKPTPRQLIALAEASLSTPTIKRIQVALIVKGYDPGTVSGHLTRETLVAVMAMQRRLGMATTGLPDPAFLKALGVGS